MSILICPVCKEPLYRSERQYACCNNHSFDISKDGYVNLLGTNKKGDLIGDNKDMAKSRRDFLSKGYYQKLAKAVKEQLLKYTYPGDTVLDICCGEGYYTKEISADIDRKFYGFDISKNMVRLAGKRKLNAEFFVANISNVPVATQSVDFAFHLFAPFHKEEFSRILKNGGTLITAIPAKNHLMGLKKELYDTPYANDEQPPTDSGFVLKDKVYIRDSITLDNSDDIMSLFKMTPYFYHTPSQGIEKLSKLNHLTTPIEFILLIYRKV